MVPVLDPTLTARVVDIIDLTEDPGPTVEQLIIADVGVGRLIAIFDSPATISRSLIGRMCEFRLTAFLPDLQPGVHGQYFVSGWKRSKPVRFHNPAISGKVLGYKDGYLLLGVPGGAIRVFTGSRAGFEEGTFVTISDFRLDVKGDVVPISE